MKSARNLTQILAKIKLGFSNITRVYRGGIKIFTLKIFRKNISNLLTKSVTNPKQIFQIFISKISNSQDLPRGVQNDSAWKSTQYMPFLISKSSHQADLSYLAQTN